ncbi:MAG: phage portal protein [Aeromicrobium sp.]
MTDEDQASLDELVMQWRAKRPRNNLRSAMYDMKNATRHLMSSNAPVEVKRRKYVLGWSAGAVDKLNRRCNIDGFYDPNGHNLDALGLPELEKSNRLRSELSQAGVSSLIHAVSWLVTVFGEEGEPDVLVLPRDATNATGMWDARRRGLRSFLSISATDDRGEPTEMTMYLDGRNGVMVKDAGRWLVDWHDHDYGIPVDPLRYKPRLGRPFGSSRLNRTVMSLHEQAIGVMIRADVNGIAYSLPRYALLGATEQAFQNADGSVKPTWQAAWDAIWAIGDDEDLARDGSNLARADVKQFHGQSPEPQTAHLRMLAQMFSGETGIPLGELGLIGDANPTSADAMIAGKDDLIAEAEMTMDGWEPDYSSSVTRAVRMLNRGDVPKNLEILPIKRNPMHVSRAQAADAGAKVLEQHPELRGTEVGMEISGLSREQIRRAKAEIRANRGREILNRLPAPEPTSGDVA